MSTHGFMILGAGFDLPKLKLEPQFQPGQVLDPYAGQGMSLSPAQLANLDRKLTPQEPAIVDAYQGSQASAMQAAEEAKPFINPKTGKLTVVRTSYDTKKPLLDREHIVVLVAAAAALLGLGATIYLLAKSKWAWAAANFFVITPLGVGAVVLGTVAIAAPKGKNA